MIYTEYFKPFVPEIYKINTILNKLETCIQNKTSFSHIRFGDGGIKFIDAILNKDVEQLIIINNKEGIPDEKVIEVMKLWGQYASEADFIDSPEVYFNDTFWARVKKPGKDINADTKIKMLKWKELYDFAGFGDNNSYCNPESNYLMLIRRKYQKTIFDIMKGRKIALITAIPEVKNNLRDYDVDIFPIVKQYENHYENSFRKVIAFIKEKANDYDLIINASGELGRIYSGLIKREGGRVVDIGFVVEYWNTGYLHPRLKHYMMPNPNNKLELKLTKQGLKYTKWI